MKNVALITGASSGIGMELARIHAQRGGDLVVVARSRDRLERLRRDLQEEHSVAVTVIEKDLARPEAPREIHEEVVGAGVEVEYLINNAGFGGRGKFHERPWEQDLAMIQVNVIALTELCRRFLPAFVERNRGRILNVSSTASLTPGPLQAVYFATKAFVTFLSNALAEELRDTDVTVTALLPGATDTGFASASGMDRTRLFDQAVPARGVAEDGYDAMLAGRLEVLSGLTPVQKVMMASIPFTPKRLVLQQVRRMQEARG